MALNVNLTFDLDVTLTLKSRSRNTNNSMANYKTHLCAKFHSLSPNSFEAVCQLKKQGKPRVQILSV